MEPYWYKAKLIRVVDGDTVDLEVSLGFNAYLKERFRVAGVNTPEIFGVKKNTESYMLGIKAKQFAEDFLENGDILIRTEKDKKGKYGRYIAHIYIEDKNLSNSLIDAGLATEVFY